MDDAGRHTPGCPEESITPLQFSLFARKKPDEGWYDKYEAAKHVLVTLEKRNSGGMCRAFNRALSAPCRPLHRRLGRDLTAVIRFPGKISSFSLSLSLKRIRLEDPEYGGDNAPDQDDETSRRCAGPDRAVVDVIIIVAVQIAESAVDPLCQTVVFGNSGLGCFDLSGKGEKKRHASA